MRSSGSGGAQNSLLDVRLSSPGSTLLCANNRRTWVRSVICTPDRRKTWRLRHQIHQRSPREGERRRVCAAIRLFGLSASWVRSVIGCVRTVM